MKIDRRPPSPTFSYSPRFSPRSSRHAQTDTEAAKPQKMSITERNEFGAYEHGTQASEEVPGMSYGPEIISSGMESPNLMQCIIKGALV